MGTNFHVLEFCHNFCPAIVLGNLKQIALFSHWLCSHNYITREEPGIQTSFLPAWKPKPLSVPFLDSSEGTADTCSLVAPLSGKGRDIPNDSLLYSRNMEDVCRVAVCSLFHGVTKRHWTNRPSIIMYQLFHLFLLYICISELIFIWILIPEKISRGIPSLYEL